MPNLRFLLLETVTANLEPGVNAITANLEPGVNAIFDDIIAALTRPLTHEEEFPKKAVEKAPKIIFKGNLEEVNMFFYQRGWGDGLPIIPPTEEKVAEMLAGTDLPADHIVGKLMVRYGKATIEKIAINAVMAGALPTYMPVLIAGVKALLEPGALLHWLCSSGASPGAFWIINGPIRNDIHLNGGVGALSPGDIANSAIGRAMGFIIKNIGGDRKGVEEMGCIGNPTKYTMVIAENEEDSPWEPLHVERGFKKEDSTITEITNMNTYSQFSQFGSYKKGGAKLEPYQGLLGSMADSFGGISRMGGMPCFILTPVSAQILFRAGYSKDDIKAFLSENVFRPYYQTNASYRGQESIIKRLPFNPGDPARVLPDPARIMTIVAGGSGPISAVIPGNAMPGSGIVTTKIDLPANWSKLVEKYKNVIPKYALW